jgi:hypothetical protein
VKAIAKNAAISNWYDDRESLGHDAFAGERAASVSVVDRGREPQRPRRRILDGSGCISPGQGRLQLARLLVNTAHCTVNGVPQ